MENRHPKRYPSRDGGQEVAEPIRTCIGCRCRKPQGELVRIAVSNGAISIGAGQREPGRGAYVCNTPACEKLVVQKERLARALKTKIDAAMLEELARTLAERRQE